METKIKKPGIAVGVMVVKDGKVLIGKRRNTASHGPGEYAFTGGKMEPGESFKDCANREVFEESGVKFKNLKFLCVAYTDKYKDFPFVLIGMKAEWESGEPRSVENENIGDWQWYDIDKPPSPLFYPSQVLIDSYKTGKNYYDKENN